MCPWLPAVLLRTGGFGYGAIRLHADQPEYPGFAGAWALCAGQDPPQSTTRPLLPPPSPSPRRYTAGQKVFENMTAEERLMRNIPKDATKVGTCYVERGWACVGVLGVGEGGRWNGRLVSGFVWAYESRGSMWGMCCVRRGRRRGG